MMTLEIQNQFRSASSLPGDAELLHWAEAELRMRRARLLSRHALSSAASLVSASSEGLETAFVLLGSRDFFRLAALDDALDRIDAGLFFVCRVCGGSVGRARLRARPETAICCDCHTA